MTYSHALQYLDGDEGATPASPARLSAYASALGSEDGRFLTLCFSSDRTGLAAAAYCRAALLAAGIRTGEIADAATGPLARVLCIDGTPISPDTLKELCHTARREEQKMWRDRALLAAEGGDSEPTAQTSSAKAPLPHLGAADRCGCVLPRLFADAGCRILLLIGDVNSPRLRALSERAPETTIVVLSGGEIRPLPTIRHKTAQVVAPTCGRAMFRRISDACARAGSRLTLTVTSGLKRHAFRTASQSFSYQGLENCTLRCGTAAALQSACLAIEALTALRRLGCSVSDEQLRAGLSSAALPWHLTPLSIQPLILADRVTDADDMAGLLQALQELAPSLARPLRAVLDPALPAPLQARLLEVCDSLEIGEDFTGDGTLLLVGSQPFLEQLTADRP